MIKLESAADEMRGVVTYQLSKGQRVCLDASAVRAYGAGEVMRLRGLGHLIPTERTAVTWCGQRAGTVPPDFDPANMKSQSFLYDVRPGDFRRTDDGWVAASSLGPGDLDAVPGFEWDAGVR